jgi:hypothetical protein
VRPESGLGFDPDEDLFDFASVASEADRDEADEDLDQVLASLRDSPPDEELLLAPQAPVSPRASEAPPPVAPAQPTAPRAPAPAPEALAPPAAAVRAAASEPVAEKVAERVHAVRPAPRSSLVSKGVVAIALSVTLLNSLLALVVLRGRAGSGDVRAVTTEAEHGGGAEEHAPRTPAEARLPDPEGMDATRAHPALDEARAQLSRGEYAAARQRLYGLLAIIDRLEDPRRSALEADCQFLVAQSLHLEALGRMEGSR